MMCFRWFDFYIVYSVLVLYCCIDMFYCSYCIVSCLGNPLSGGERRGKTAINK